MNVGIQLCTQFALDADHNACYRSILEEARLVEQLGFSSVWIGQHDVPSDCAYFDPLIVASGILSVTENVNVGIREIRVPLFNPVALAQFVASLDVIGNGRMILDICTEYRKESSEAFGIPFEENRPRLKEGVNILKKLWCSPSVTYEGKFYHLSNVSINPKPIQKPWPPLWITVWRRDEVAEAVEIGDGLRPALGTTIPELKKEYEEYKTALKKAERNLSEVTFDLLRDAYVAEDSETARVEYEPHILKKYQTYLKWGVEEDVIGTTEAELSYNSLQERFIVGSPEECIRQIEAHRSALGLNHCCIRIHLPEMPEELAIKATKLFGERVLPHIC